MKYTNINNDVQYGGANIAFYYAALAVYVGLTIGLIVAALNLDREFQKHRNNPDKFDKPDHQTFEVPVIAFAIGLCVCWVGITFFYTR
tara:strand:- start:120 stop:383 length:264 start_codon:yes stop_codon:yes gene_type:complete